MSSSFLDSIRVDQATIDKCNDVSKQAAQNASANSGKKGGLDDGGYERGDSPSAPLSQGREPGFKWADTSDTQSNSSDAQSMSNQSGDASFASSMGEGTEGGSAGGVKGGTSLCGESGVSGGCEGGNSCGCGM